MRRALGATKLRLLQQLLTESLVLAIAGGICGVILAMWTSELLERSLPSLTAPFPIQLELSPDWRVMAYATIISLTTTVVCGLLPAWRTARASGLVTFKGEIGGSTRRRRPLGLVAQVFLSFHAAARCWKLSRGSSAATGYRSWFCGRRPALRLHLRPVAVINT